MLKKDIQSLPACDPGPAQLLFELINVPLSAPDYSCVSKQYPTDCYLRARSPIWSSTPLDSSSLVRVNGRSESMNEKRRVWRKLHLAVDPATHDIVAAEVSLENVHDAEVLPTLLNPLRRVIATVPTS
ncbi:hypothetical protein D3C84_914270 [compost metagenome]